jgi:Rrf2 family transcriptional regulator, nitric oxide-sensitive transcriptional repressor
VLTVRGQHGGMRLARPPEEINVGTVVRRTEPDLHIAPCFGDDTTCCIQPACVLQGALQDALAAFMTVLDGVTLADLIRPKRKLSALLRLQPAGQEAPLPDSRH